MLVSEPVFFLLQPMAARPLRQTMLSLEHVKKLLNDPTLSDEEVLEIRDQFYTLCEIIYERWRAEKDQERLSRQKRLNDVSPTVGNAVGNAPTIPTALKSYLPFCPPIIPPDNGDNKL